jgi:hypothetical protein
MNLISFDVGIKNMSYCIFEINEVGHEVGFLIKDWNVLNLMDETRENPKCNCILNKKKPKKKASILTEDPKECGKAAKYAKHDHYYCEKHSKSQNVYIQYNKECSPSQLKKKKLEELKSLCNQYLITQDENNCAIQYSTKTALLNVLQNLYNKMLEPIKEMKTKNAGETGLISIGRNMRTLLDKIPDIHRVTHVIIENQISPIANRMKTIQGMLAQYFIMKETECSPSIHIEFVSSFNKLKNFTHLRNTDVENMDESSYKSNKKDGIMVCSHFLNNNTQLSMWVDKINCKKKDDLADCFLQGIWYLHSKHKIHYNEECKIDISQCYPKQK